MISRLSRRRLAVAILCTLCVLVLTHLPLDPTPKAWQDGPFHLDKIEHVLAYGLMATLYLRALHHYRRRTLFFVVATLVILALVDELTQPLVGRTASVWDFLADLAGASLALAAAFVWKNT